jgi:hypothetical protein
MWKRSKRLITGSIVTLSPAYDHSTYVARAESTQLDTQQEWVMIEARSGYYEQASQACNQIYPR